MCMKPIDAEQVNYVAKQPARDSDIFIPFVDLMWQRASYPEVCFFISAICDDFHNMGTSIAKLKLFFDSRNSFAPSMMASNFAATEIEYLIILTRSVFDLLQEIISRIWSNYVRMKNPEEEKLRRSRKLPDTFSKMILRDKNILKNSNDIQQQYGIPKVLAKEYANSAVFFVDLRDMRDQIVHGGSARTTIFNTEKGFCVSSTDKPFNKFNGWDESHRYNNNLYSILPWIANIIIQTISSCNNLMNALASCVLFPPEIAPGYRVFVRGPATKSLYEVLEISKGNSPWWK